MNSLYETIYNKADIIVKRKDGKEDIITIISAEMLKQYYIQKVQDIIDMQNDLDKEDYGRSVYEVDIVNEKDS